MYKDIEHCLDMEGVEIKVGATVIFHEYWNVSLTKGKVSRYSDNKIIIHYYYKGFRNLRMVTKENSQRMIRVL